MDKTNEEIIYATGYLSVLMLIHSKDTNDPVTLANRITTVMRDWLESGLTLQAFRWAHHFDNEEAT